MMEINEFKVIGLTEPVIGKVVEFTQGGTFEEFKLTEYYINENQIYDNHEITRFSVAMQDTPQKYMKEFKKILRKYVRLKDVFIEENVMEFLMLIA